MKVENIELDLQNKEFNNAVELIKHTNRLVYLTGKAGTGKTTFLKYIRTTTKKNTVVVAPTGVAAINAGGVTIHSFFQIPFGPFVPNDTRLRNSGDETNKETIYTTFAYREEKLNIIQKMELLIIDEVSMVRADTLDVIDKVLKAHRKKPNEPFGGVQVLFIGDTFQLPPIADDEQWEILSHYYDSPFFFNSNVIKNSDIIYLELKKIYRQTDQEFINLLNNVRINSLTNSDYNKLNSRYDPYFEGEDEDYITLATHNYKVNEINNSRLEYLENDEYEFHAEIEDDFPKKNMSTDEILYLKEGAQIMFVKNDSNGRFFNGKIGKIKTLLSNKIEVVFDDGHSVDVEKETWENIKYNYNKESHKVEAKVIGTFTQYPVRLAWAITVHKSQGLTFNKVIADLGKAFAPGQVYVALSRCTSFESLVLKTKLHHKAIKTDSNILEFAKSETKQKIISNVIIEAKNKQTKQSGRNDIKMTIEDYKKELDKAHNLVNINNQMLINFIDNKVDYSMLKSNIELQIVNNKKLFGDLHNKLEFTDYKGKVIKKTLTVEWWDSLSEEWKDLMLFNLNIIPKIDFTKLEFNHFPNSEELTAKGLYKKNTIKVLDILNSLSTIKGFIISNYYSNYINEKSSLEPISELTGIIHLFISHNKTELLPVSKLINLTHLVLSDNSSSLDPIAKLKKVELINIDNNNSDLKPLSYLSNLNTLYLRDNKANLLSIKGVFLLKLHLSLDYDRYMASGYSNYFMSISSFLSNQQRLEVLELRCIGHSVDWSFISNLKHLKSLKLECLKTDLTHLTSLDKLVELNIKTEFKLDLTNINKIDGIKVLKIEYLGGETDIRHIAGLRNLEKLHLKIRSVDLSPLSKLSTLKELEIYLNSSDLHPISNLHNLETLILIRNNADLSPISNLYNLESLDLSYNEEVDLFPISKLTKLKTLNILYNKKSNSAITSLENLENLKISSTTPEDFNYISRINNLQYLELENTSKDISNVSKLKSLKYIDITSEIIDLSPLVNLPFLETLSYNFSPQGSSNLDEIENIPNTILYIRSNIKSINILRDKGCFIKSLNNYRNPFQLLDEKNKPWWNSLPIFYRREISKIILINKKLRELDIDNYNYNFNLDFETNFYFITGEEYIEVIDYNDNIESLIENTNFLVLEPKMFHFRGVSLYLFLMLFNKIKTLYINNNETELELNTICPNLTTLKLFVTKDKKERGGIKTDYIHSLTNIKSLVLDGVMGDLSFLKNFTKLLSLRIINSPYLNTDSLKDIIWLKELYIERTNDISFLSRLTELKFLSLINNSKSLEPIKNLINLKIINLNNNKVNLEPLSDLISLIKLNLNNNSAQLDPINNLYNLEILELENNNQPLDPLSSLKKIRELNLINNKSELHPISNLFSLSKLKVSCHDKHLHQITDLHYLLDNEILNGMSAESDVVEKQKSEDEIWWSKLSYEWQGLIMFNIELNSKIEEIGIDFKYDRYKDYIKNYEDISGDKYIEADLKASVILYKLNYLTRFYLIDSFKITNFAPISRMTNIEYFYHDNSDNLSISFLKELPNLRNLILNGNRYKDTFILTELTNLVGLSGVNDLEIITKLNNLESLNISGIRGDIEKITTLKKLKSLNLDFFYGNDISPILELKNLEVLSLDKNKIDLPDFSPLTKLKTLLLTNCYTDIGAISNLESLEELSLEINAEYQTNNTIDLSPIRTLYNLKILNLSKKRIDDLSPLRLLEKLEELNLSQTTVDINPISGLINLRKLNLSNYKGGLKDIENLTNLKYLDLYNYSPSINISKNIDTSLNPLSNLEKLEFLNLSNNSRDLDPISNLVNLKKLILSDNNDPLKHFKVKKKQLDALSKLTKLKYLDLHKNLVSLNPISNLINLEKLKLTDNEVSIEPLKSLTSLVNLELSGKNINISYLSKLHKLKRLKYLSGGGMIDINHLKDIHNIEDLEYSHYGNFEALKKLTKLKYLKLKSYRYSSLESLSKIKGLKYLEIYDNSSDLCFVNCLRDLKRLRISNLGPYDNKVDIDSILNTHDKIQIELSGYQSFKLIAKNDKNNRRRDDYKN